MDFDSHYSMYGITQSPYGSIQRTRVIDIVESAIHQENNQKLKNEFVENSKTLTQEMKELEDTMELPIKKSAPRGVTSGGNIFRVKRKRSTYTGKYY